MEWYEREVIEYVAIHYIPIPWPERRATKAKNKIFDAIESHFLPFDGCTFFSLVFCVVNQREKLGKQIDYEQILWRDADAPFSRWKIFHHRNGSKVAQSFLFYQ